MFYNSEKNNWIQSLLQIIDNKGICFMCASALQSLETLNNSTFPFKMFF